jgi:hypothetical protein
MLEVITRLWRRQPPLPRNREFESPASVARFRESQAAHERPAPGERVLCPRCSRHAALEPLTCEHCGFPFICDTAPVDLARVRRRNISWRTLLGAGALIFWLTNVVLVAAGSETYQGDTIKVVATLSPDTQSGIPISGPDGFVKRTQLALDLLRQRAPDYYYRMGQSVTSIDFLGQNYLEGEGARISLEGIGAVATPSTGQVQVLVNTAFPSGFDGLTDGDLFSYTGVLIHELRHIELYRIGESPGGWEEEVLCEQAAYAALQQMDAPGAVLARYQLYLSDPQARRYQNWYKWYDQFE